jgi:hypothetical protein
MVDLHQIPGYILHALIGLFMSAVIVSANALARWSLRLRSDQTNHSVFPKKMVLSLLLFSIPAITISYVQVKQVILHQYANPSLCFSVLKSYEKQLGWTTRMRDDRPENLLEFLSELENSGLESDFLQALFTCSGSRTKEISFEYFNLLNLKPEAQVFIILYERSSNHRARSDRTVIYSTGEVDTLLEDELYVLLLKQSISPNSFRWDPSIPDQPSYKSWWEREQEAKATLKAISFSVVLLLVLGYAFTVAIRLNKEQNGGGARNKMGSNL